MDSPQTVTLSSDQAGAAIFYTLDGSQPAPRGPTSILYTAPFVVSCAFSLKNAGVAGGVCGECGGAGELWVTEGNYDQIPKFAKLTKFMSQEGNGIAPTIAFPNRVWERGL